jgi:hypothetical protein
LQPGIAWPNSTGDVFNCRRDFFGIDEIYTFDSAQEDTYEHERTMANELFIAGYTDYLPDASRIEAEPGG